MSRWEIDVLRIVFEESSERASGGQYGQRRWKGLRREQTMEGERKCSQGRYAGGRALLCPSSSPAFNIVFRASSYAVAYQHVTVHLTCVSARRSLAHWQTHTVTHKDLDILGLHWHAMILRYIAVFKGGGHYGATFSRSITCLLRVVAARRRRELEEPLTPIPSQSFAVCLNAYVRWA